MNVIEGVKLQTPNKFSDENGEILHAIRNFDESFVDFGEAYFSSVKKNKIKAWKRHKKMTLNIVVPFGSIAFVVYDDRKLSSTENLFIFYVLSRKNYKRITIPPMLWLGFMGLGDDENCLLNVASIPHDPEESDRKHIDEIPYEWEELEA